MIARALTRVGIKLFQSRRRNPSKIAKLKCPHLENRAPHAVSLPAPCRSHDATAQARYVAPALERATENDIFHQRNIRVATDHIKNIAPDKERLIAGADFG